MGVTKSNKNNISSPKGNSLALFVDYNDGNLKLKDINGNVEKFTAYAGSMPVGVLQMEGGVALDGTLRAVQDQNGNNSPLFLSTNSVTGHGSQGILSDTIFGAFQYAGYNIVGEENTFVNAGFFGNFDSPLSSINVIKNTGFGLNAIKYEGYSNDALGNLNIAFGVASLSNSVGGENIGIGMYALQGTFYDETITVNSNIYIGTNIDNITGMSGSSNVTIGNNVPLRASNTVGIGSYTANNLVFRGVEIGYKSESLGSPDTLSVYIGYKPRNEFSGATKGNNTRIGRYPTGIAGTAISGSTSIGQNYGPIGLSIGNEINTANISAEANTVIGNTSLLTPATDAIAITIIGSSNLIYAGIPSYNTAIGYQNGHALSSTSGNTNNVFVGTNNLYNSTSAFRRAVNSCTYIGVGIAVNTTSISGHNNNVGIGEAVLQKITTGSGNVAIGRLSMFSATTAGSNVAINAFYMISTGGSNIAIYGLSGLTSGSNNIGIGTTTSSTSTANSTAIGHGILQTGSNHTLIGPQVSSGGFGGSIILGTEAASVTANQFVVGSASYNAGTINVESLTSDTTWTVRINGTQYKMLLKA